MRISCGPTEQQADVIAKLFDEREQRGRITALRSVRAIVIHRWHNFPAGSKEAEVAYCLACRDFLDNIDAMIVKEEGK
jgi:hypothetical protein